MNTSRQIMSMLKAAVPLGVVLAFSTSANAAVNFTEGTGARLVTQQVTGVYSLVNVNKDGTSYTTIGLFNKGNLVEAHTKGAGGWLAKKSGNTPKVLSTSKFQQLINIAGLNKNVETLPAAKRTEFYQVAGLSAGSSTAPPPSEVSPGPGDACPPGYELYKKKPVGPGTCRMITYRLDGVSERFASLWNSLALIPSAEAAQVLKAVLIHVGDFSYVTCGYVKDDAGQELYAFGFLGFMIEFFFTPEG